MTEWRSDSPDWSEGGLVEVLLEDGSMKRGTLVLEDACFTGDESYPVWRVDFEDGSSSSIHDFEKWRACGGRGS